MKQPSLFLLTFYLLGFSTVFLSSCKTLYPNRMFQSAEYEYFQSAPELMKDYVIKKGDLLTLEVFAREGFDLVDVLAKGTGGNQNNRAAAGYSYLVDQNGFVEFPIFGTLLVEGMTEKQLEDLIELKSTVLFNEPFAFLQVINRRVVIFKGSEGSVIALNEGPTSLLEVIAQSGGLSRDLKAFKIKILRGDLKAPQIINIDLSTMEGVKEANLIVQANDVIYIEDRIRLASGLVKELAPVLSLISSLTAIVILVKR